MSSTDLETPPLKSILIAILVVVGLHVLTAVALVAMKPSAPKVAPPKQTPPIEIELVSLPAALPKEPVKVVKSVEKEVTKVVIDKSTLAPKPQAIIKPKPVTETPKKPVVQERKPDITPLVKKEKTTSIAQEKPSQKQTKQEEPNPAIDKAISEQLANNQKVNNQQAEQRRLVAAQAEKAAQEAQLQQAQAQAQAQEAQRVANAKASAEAANDAAQKAARAAKQAEKAAKAAAESNEPVNFTASSANWVSAPNFSFPERVARRANSGDTLNVVLILRVNKQGGIDNVRIAQSSGNAALDKEATRQVRSGKFKPFTNNAGVPVVGNVTLPVSYAVP
ncbi:energy transducer TonB [Psychrobacter cryohalolentis]|uniref:Outer membrane transport energization protein TonB n=1 Tax=Psychrobacter cryohalolentis (strain ATCC BAA-1226 / DSM 17306 / VKM B-2378 / K5) TaxID=335284 RepID=Q1Q9H0_PSYCK|nr:energy transducer TonB [Psychrobacter cryohalolentis]ABE75683.1 outer membrane transport energization protein TonB [Psychrobacter cryohalolentis K5]ASE25873.1 energy transducer TonB [Psychrobacter cryohalolentis]